MTSRNLLTAHLPDDYPNNETRATEGGEILASWRGWHQGGDVDDDIADVLTLLIHYCDRAGVGADDVWERAKGYHAEETDPASGVPGGPPAAFNPTAARR